MLRRAYDNGCGDGRPPLIMIDDKEEFVLQTILQHRPLNKTQGDSGISYGRVMALSTTVGSLSACSSEGLLRRCKTTGTRLVLLCKQLVQAWHLKTKLLLPLEAGVEHLVLTVAEVVAATLPEVPTEVHLNLSARS